VSKSCQFTKPRPLSVRICAIPNVKYLLNITNITKKTLKSELYVALILSRAVCFDVCLFIYRWRHLKIEKLKIIGIKITNNSVKNIPALHLKTLHQKQNKKKRKVEKEEESSTY
jgi:hypothetical protein